MIGNVTADSTAETTTFTCTVNGSPASPATPAITGQPIIAATASGGAVSGTAQVYTGAITLTQSEQFNVRVLSGGTWSALLTAQFSPNFTALRVAELMYHPLPATAAEIAKGYVSVDGAEDFEFVEIQNTGSTAVSLAGLEFTNGVTFTFPDVTLAAGAYIVACSDPAAFITRYANGQALLEAEYGSTNWTTVAAECGYSGHFNNNGEEVTLSNPNGGVVEDFTYSNSWYPQTDGGGYALVPQSITESASLLNSSSGWESCGTLNGTPGAADPVTLPAPNSVIVNEVLANPTASPGDMIELYNTTSQAINIGGWFLGDSSADLTAYQIPSGAMINAGGYYVLTQTGNFGFTLDPDGSTVYVSNDYDGQAGGYQESQGVPAMPAGLSYGLYTKSDGATNFTLLQTPTFGAANSVPYVSPLVTDEIMYDPSQPTATEAADGYVDHDFEYVELYNRSSSPVSLANYCVTGGVGYTPGWLPDGSLANDYTVSALTASGTTATVTLSTTASGLQNGDYVHVAGAAQGPYDGDFIIANVTVALAAGTTTFTYTMSSSPVSPATPLSGQSITAGKDSEFESLASGATATWSASNVAAGSYTVWAHLNLYDGDNNPLSPDSQAQYTVTCDGTPTTVTIDQDQVPATLGVTGMSYNNASGLVTVAANNTPVNNNALAAGSIVHISGATPSQYDGTFVVQSATSTSFTYSLASGLNLAAATGTITAGLNDVWISLGTYSASGAVSVKLTRTTNAAPSEWTIAGGMELVSSQNTIVLGTPVFGNTNTSLPTPPATLAPGQYAVIVSNYAAFEERYNPTGTSNILVLGVYSGHLGNGGDTVDIDQIGSRGGGDVTALNGYTPFYRVDHVSYNNAAPWPTSADGGGPALIRIHTADYGNDAINWEASNSGGTPGAANLAADTIPPTVPTGLTAQALVSPTPEISLSWSASSDTRSSVAYYEIYRDGATIGTSATTSYVDTTIVAGTNYTYAVAAVNRDGYSSAQSSSIEADLPAVTSYLWLDSQDVAIYFNEPLTSASATSLSNYSMTVTGGSSVALSAVVLSRDGTVVTLTTSSVLTAGTAYTITMKNLATVSSNPLPASLPLAVTYQSPMGTILDEVWDDLDSGDSVSDLTSPALNPAYPNDPTYITYLTSFNAPYNTGVDDYGQRVQGYIYPPTTGQYVFWVASDDASQLWLSTNASPANIGSSPIAYTDSWTPYEDWTEYSSQQSAPISLVAGQHYYVEALMKQGGGGDSLSVAWMLLPSGGTQVPDASATATNNSSSVPYSAVSLPTPSSFSVKTLTDSSTTATATFSSAPGFVVGQNVTISGASPLAYDGTFAITAVSGSTIKYTLSGSLTSATGTINATPVGISASGTTAYVWYPNNGYAAGTSITVAGATPTTFNGTYSITTVVNSNLFEYTMSATPSPLTASGTITVQQCGITYSGTTATVYLPNNGYTVGEWVNVSGASPSTYDGAFQVTAVATNTFSYTVSTTPSSPGSGSITVQQVPISYSGTTATVWLPNNNYGVGEWVDITGATPSTYDGLFQITAVGANTFSYTLSATPSSVATGTVTVQQVPITYSGTTATAWLPDNGLAVDDWINITGASPSTYDGLYEITAVTTNTFTYTMAGTPSALPATGTILADNVTLTETVIPGADLSPYIVGNVDLAAPAAPADLERVGDRQQHPDLALLEPRPGPDQRHRSLRHLPQWSALRHVDHC